MNRKAIIAVSVMVLVAAVCATAMAVAGSRRTGTVMTAPEEPILYDDEMPLETGIEVYMTDLRLSTHYYAAALGFDMPGRTVDVSCDHNYLFGKENVKDFVYTEKVRQLTVDGENYVMVRGQGEPTNDHYYLEYNETTLRMIIREDDRIVGYAMACFWDPKGPKNSSYFNDGMLVKAVLFDDHAKGRITEEEVNARLDALYNDYVIGEKLFDTQTENAMHHYGDVLEVVP